MTKWLASDKSLNKLRIIGYLTSDRSKGELDVWQEIVLTSQS